MTGIPCQIPFLYNGVVGGFLSCCAWNYSTFEAMKKEKKDIEKAYSFMEGCIMTCLS